MRSFIALLLLCGPALFVGCGNSPSTGSNSNGAIKTGVAPIADAEVAIIEMEKPDAYGTIKLELYSNIAPQAVARFKELAKEGVYDGTTFHRVNDSVIQSGDPNSKDNDPIMMVRKLDEPKYLPVLGIP